MFNPKFTKSDMFLRGRRPLVQLSLMQCPEDCLVTAVMVTVPLQGNVTQAGPKDTLPAFAACSQVLNSRCGVVSVLSLQAGLLKEQISCSRHLPVLRTHRCCSGEDLPPSGSCELWA